jgi:hypothetical protein
MGLIYDNPDLAALTPTRLAAEEAGGPGGLEGYRLNYLDGLEPRKGTGRHEEATSWCVAREFVR